MSSSVSSQSSTLVSSSSNSSISSSSSPTEAIAPPGLSVQHPIPPASEPKQFRAIGLIQAKYEPSEESFTRGFLKTDDGQAIDAVLLGRVMSLVKKHIDLEQSHLWVVYPRTREKQEELHVQIVGVWEPETLAQLPTPATDEAPDNGEESVDTTDESPVTESAPVEAAEADAVGDEGAADDQPDGSPQLLSKPKLMAPIRPPAPPAAIAPPAAEPAPVLHHPQDGYFSIRGEIINVVEDRKQIIVRIQQSPRKGSTEAKAFKLMLIGALEGKLVGHFWDLNVKREADQLVVQDGTRIGIAPPRHKPKTAKPTKKKRPNVASKIKRKEPRGKSEGDRPTPPSEETAVKDQVATPVPEAATAAPTEVEKVVAAVEGTPEGETEAVAEVAEPVAEPVAEVAEPVAEASVATDSAPESSSEATEATETTEAAETDETV